MAIAFPTTGLTAGVTLYSYSGRTWLWTGTVWQSVGTVSGATGATGSAATVAVGTTTTGAAATAASVTNSGTTSAAVFNFTVPQGVQGATGADSTVPGPTGTGYSGVTSTSSQSVSIGAKTWTLNTAGAFITGDRIRAIQSATAYVEGTATVTGTTLTMTSDVSVGTTGPYTNWTFSIAGLQGIQGATGASVQGATGSQGTTLSLQNVQSVQYTIKTTDANNIIVATGTGTQYLSIPTNTTQAITIGTSVHFLAMGSGTYTIQAVTSGTTSIQSTGATVAKPVLRAQYAMATAIKLATDAWIVTGDIS